jgi:hypothetical protein
LCALIFSTPALAADRAVTPTVQVEDLSVRLDDVIVTPKKDYAHFLWDSFPYKAAITAAAKGQNQDEQAYREKVLKLLANAVVALHAPKLRHIKADVVEFTERNEYGAPLWSSVKKIQHLEFDLAPSKPLKKAKP